MTNDYIEQVAADFWNKSYVNYKPSPDLQRAISNLLNVDVITLGKLSIQKILDWFQQHQIPFKIESDERLLHGFLIAQSGVAFIFINGTDCPEERSFTLAHEIAHFIIETYIPTQQAIKKFGPSILPVLNGERSATISEQLTGVLSNISLKPYIDILDTKDLSGFDRLNIWSSEKLADQLAIELLAPRKLLLAEYRYNCYSQISYCEALENLHVILVKKYALPNIIAKEYAKEILREINGGPTLAETWKIKF